MNNQKDIQVLVVDDEKEIQEILKKILKKKGYSVETRGNGLEALEVLQQKKIDVVLLDIMMPKLDGIETLRRIKSQFSDMVVLMLTAYGTIQTAREAMHLGAYDYITKPFDIDFLYHVLKESVSERILPRRRKVA